MQDKFIMLNGNSRGFTIVELLIVIVVIGILAAITIVAYTGITTQANQKTALGNAQTVKSAVDTFYAEKGTYPAVDTSGANAAAKATNTTTNINGGSYGKLSSSVNLSVAAALTADNTTILYALKGTTGACFGYYPAGGSFAWITSGDAATMTNAASPSCT
jgi:prepilin-type N-terminal cleavage/methylation domain-containing protein